MLAGTVARFADATLATLYPDREAFVTEFNQKIDDLLAARFLLSEDAAKLRLFVESKDQQKCINELNKNLAKVAKAQGKDICKCLKDASKAKLGGLTIEECTTADRKGKVAKAKSKTVTQAEKKCVEPPDFGITDPTTVNSAAMNKELDLIHDLFGSDLDEAIVVLDGTKPVKAQSKCQLEAAKLAKKCQETKLKEFLKCEKNGLKEATVHDHLTLADCIGKDVKGKIEKTCVTKLAEKITKKCTDLDYAALFPGECSSEDTLADFATCLEQRVECRFCLAVDEADDLDRNCDEFDDGLFNASCP